MTVEPRGCLLKVMFKCIGEWKKTQGVFPMDVLLGRVIHVVFVCKKLVSCRQKTDFTHQVSAKWIGIFIFLRRILVLPPLLWHGLFRFRCFRMEIPLRIPGNFLYKRFRHCIVRVDRQIPETRSLRERYNQELLLHKPSRWANGGFAGCVPIRWSVPNGYLWVNLGSRISEFFRKLPVTLWITHVAANVRPADEKVSSWLTVSG